MEKVSIVIRTCDRPILLKRALTSVFSQTYHNFDVIIINNGGREDLLMKVIEEHTIGCREKIMVKNLGHIATRGKALNIGISNSQGEYIAILDDDDSWDPQFLERCVEFLNKNPSTNGVATRSVLVTEQLKENIIVQLNKKIFNPQLKNASLLKILRCNLFTINSFVYRRVAGNDIGNYREDLLVLEDWEFNLRFLLNNKVGILAYPLAYYHKRINLNSSSTYLNSNVDEHLEVDKSIRREYATKFLKNNDVFKALLIYVFGMINNISRIVKGVTMT